MTWSVRRMLFPLFLLVFFVCAGCQTCPPGPLPERAFCPELDGMAYPNQLAWAYQINPATGRMETKRREPAPTYSLHCFGMARDVRQFFRQSQFAPSASKASEMEYRELIRKVLDRDSRCEAGQGTRVMIPGFKNLHEFSQAEEKLLKSEGGRAWQSFFQRGNWRMVFPFSRNHQRREAARLERELEEHRLPIVHVVRFPALTINHVVLLFQAVSRHGVTEFSAYDPNDPTTPLRLRFDSGNGRFEFPATSYFQGGRVDVYEIYRSAIY